MLIKLCGQKSFLLKSWTYSIKWHTIPLRIRKSASLWLNTKVINFPLIIEVTKASRKEKGQTPKKTNTERLT